MNAMRSCSSDKLKALLLATDRSEYSEGAVREAINIAGKCSSKLYVISVIERNPAYVYETFGTSIMQEEEKEAAAGFESVKKMAAEQGVSSCETILRKTSEPYRVIVEEAAKNKVDMIIVGRRGRRGVEKVLMGSSAAKVIGHAPCNVLIVPRSARVEFGNILVATDGSEYANAAVMEAVGMAKSGQNHIIALSAYFLENELENARANIERAIEVAQREGVTVEALTPRGKPDDAIVETAGGRAVDLIVMGAYGKTGLKKLLMGSTTEKVIGRVGCAVLVVKTQAESSL
ncbi:MAG: universal stress protein [Nitrospiraceae bacterium]|nr:universal stress protein [Nitrospiraceae bacterium]